MIDNKKFLKEISNIFTAADKAKKVVLSEMDKIDEKYRKLAEEEKKQLNSILANLNEQIKLYGPMVNGDKVDDAPVAPEESAASSEEEKVVDTIYEDNNVYPFGEESEEANVAEASLDTTNEDTTDMSWPDAVAVDANENVEEAEASEEDESVRPADISEDWPISAEW